MKFSGEPSIRVPVSREGRLIPIFDYQCDECGLRFERPGRMDRAMEGHECPSCGTKAARVPPSSLGYTFNHNPTAVGPVPQNTGVSAYDYSVDRIVGADAADRWATVDKRNSVKREVLRDAPGATKKDLSVLPDGSYRVMEKEEKKTTRNTRAFHNLAAGLAQSKDRYHVLQQTREKGRQ